jgi:hypothetical protein
MLGRQGIRTPPMGGGTQQRWTLQFRGQIAALRMIPGAVYCHATVGTTPGTGWDRT